MSAGNETKKLKNYMIRYSYFVGISKMRTFDYWLCNHTDKTEKEVMELFNKNVSAPSLKVESVSFEEI